MHAGRRGGQARAARASTLVPALPRPAWQLARVLARSAPPLCLGFVLRTPPFLMPLRRPRLLETTAFLSEASQNCISSSTWEFYI